MGRQERAQERKGDRVGLAVRAGTAALALGIYGGTELYAVMRNDRPTVVAYGDLVRNGPPAEWLRVTGANSERRLRRDGGGVIGCEPRVRAAACGGQRSDLGLEGS